MMNASTRYLFSAALPLGIFTAFVGAGVLSKAETRSPAPMMAAAVARSAPPIDTPAPIIELDDNLLNRAPVELKHHKVVEKPKKVITPHKVEKVFTCDPTWRESNYGGKYQTCEWK